MKILQATIILGVIMLVIEILSVITANPRMTGIYNFWGGGLFTYLVRRWRLA